MSDELYPDDSYGGFSNLATCGMFCFVQLLLKDGDYPSPAAPVDPEELSQLLLRYFEFLYAENRIWGSDAAMATKWMEADFEELYPEALELWVGDER